MKLVTKIVRKPSGDHFGPVVKGTSRYIFDQMLDILMFRLEPAIRFRLKDPILFRITGNIS